MYYSPLTCVIRDIYYMIWLRQTYNDLPQWISSLKSLQSWILSQRCPSKIHSRLWQLFLFFGFIFIYIFHVIDMCFCFRIHFMFIFIFSDFIHLCTKPKKKNSEVLCFVFPKIIFVLFSPMFVCLFVIVRVNDNGIKKKSS